MRSLGEQLAAANCSELGMGPLLAEEPILTLECDMLCAGGAFLSRSPH
jgi:hypothetical protein